MKVTVIGAGGFLGGRIVRLLQEVPWATEIRAVDRTGVTAGPRTKAIIGDFADPVIREEALKGADAVIHLAAVLGGAAEVDPALARRVNIDATLDLIDFLKEKAPGTRFVFASTIAALKTPLPEPATDDAALGATLLYGAHKHMIEVALTHHAARGWLDAVSLRPAGIMARDGADSALKSAFMSRLFYAVKRGQDITLPVAEDSCTWLASVDNVARNFIHAVQLPALGEVRAFTLPALPVRFDHLVAALQRRFPASRAIVRFDPDPQTIALFGSMPDLRTETADALGFSRDSNAEALVRGSMEEDKI